MSIVHLYDQDLRFFTLVEFNHEPSDSEIKQYSEMVLASVPTDELSQIAFWPSCYVDEDEPIIVHRN